MAYEWTCPFCAKPQVATDANRERHHFSIEVGKSNLGNLVIVYVAIRCLSCNELSLQTSIHETKVVHGNALPGAEKMKWRLLPESSAKPQPDFIPEPIRQDYVEACRIRDLSPKASATLARRCLQGMIRDFCGISKSRLIDEINELEKLVDDAKAPLGVTPESVDAIDNVRSIGNIGAHMERDVNTIIEIDPDEAQTLIELIETLLEDWYVARQTRAERFGNIAALRAKKEAIKSGGGVAK
jgi:hypothetical protein